MLSSEKITTIKIESNTSLLDALRQMDKSGRRLLLVFKEKSFLGLLSIGDIQRAIINGTSTDSMIVDILRKNPKVAYTDTSIEDIKDEMLKYRMEFMPIINKKGSISNILFWEDLFIKKEPPPKSDFNLPIVIMAGGLGTRLKPITNILPKPLMPLNEVTILEEIFRRFSNHGSKNFFLSVNYKADLIEYYIRNLQLPYKIQFLKEATPLGTAGSLLMLKGLVNETFFVSNCDIIVEQDYSEILDYHRENKNEITIVAALKNISIPYGIIKSGKNGKLNELVEKPDLTFKINSGMYILEPHVINEIPCNQTFHITQLIEKVHHRNGNIGVFPVSEKSWKDIGEWKEYLKYINKNER